MPLPKLNEKLAQRMKVSVPLQTKKRKRESVDDDYVPHDFKNVTTTSKRPKTRPQGNNPSAIFSQLREFLTAEENYDPSSSDITTVSQPSYLKRFTWREAARIALGRLEDVPPPTTKPEKFASQTTIGSKPKTLTSPTKRRSHPKKEKPVQTALQIAISSFTDITAAPPYPLLRTTTISRNTIEKSVPTTPVADKELSAQGQTFLTQEQRGDTFDEGGAVNAPLAGIASYKHISISHYEENKENEPCSETSFDRRQIPGSVEGDILPTAWTQYQLSVQTTNTWNESVKVDLMHSKPKVSIASNVYEEFSDTLLHSYTSAFSEHSAAYVGEQPLCTDGVMQMELISRPFSDYAAVGDCSLFGSTIDSSLSEMDQTYDLTFF